MGNLTTEMLLRYDELMHEFLASDQLDNTGDFKLDIFNYLLKDNMTKAYEFYDIMVAAGDEHVAEFEAILNGN